MTAEENLAARVTSARHPADLRRWTRRLSARLQRKVDAPRTRREPRTNSPVKRHASPEEKAEKHLAADEDRAEQTKAAADRPSRDGSERGTVKAVPRRFLSESLGETRTLFSTTSCSPREMRSTASVRSTSSSSIFEPFVQVKPKGAVTNGTGLGLPIGRRLATAMGGSLNAESEPGKGSTFISLLQRT